MPKTLVFSSICTQRRRFQLVLDEIIDTVFAKTSPNRSFSMIEYERFELVFTKTRVYKFGHCRSADSFLILELRRARDQLVFKPKKKSINVGGNSFIVIFSSEITKI